MTIFGVSTPCLIEIRVSSNTGSHLSGPETLFSDRLTLLRQPLSRLRAEVTASGSPVGLLKGEKRQLREVDAGAVMLCMGPP